MNRDELEKKAEDEGNALLSFLRSNPFQAMIFAAIMFAVGFAAAKVF